MSKNAALQAIANRLTADIPSVTWTRRALTREQVSLAGGPWPTGCVVGYQGVHGDQPGNPWRMDVKLLVHARSTTGNANAEMLDLLDRVEASLSNATDIDGVAHVQLANATIDQDDDQDGSCGLFVTLIVTL